MKKHFKNLLYKFFFFKNLIFVSLAGAATFKKVSKVYIRYFPFYIKFEDNAKKILD